MLNVTGLAMRRENRLVLDMPALSIAGGQDLLITGPSGSGKTTLLHILGGLLRPTAGDVRFNAQSYAALSDPGLDALRKNNFGFIFQQLHLIRHLSVRDNISLANPKADLPALLAPMNLSGFEKKRVSDLSVGEAQRVAAARALANRPAVVFADEPTSALDDASAAAVMDLLRARAGALNASLVVATHDARIMAGFATTLTLQNGKVSR